MGIGVDGADVGRVGVGDVNGDGASQIPRGSACHPPPGADPQGIQRLARAWRSRDGGHRRGGIGRLVLLCARLLALPTPEGRAPVVCVRELGGAPVVCVCVSVVCVCWGVLCV